MLKSQLILALLILFSTLFTPTFAALKVGIILPKTGAFENLGMDAFKGASFAINRINNLKNIEVVIEDNKSDNIESTNVARKLINEDHINLLIGEISEQKSSLISPIAEAKKIPLFSIISANDKFLNLSKNNFAISFADNYQGTLLANFAKTTLKKKNALIIVDSSFDYSKNLAKSFKNEFLNLGGNVATDDEYSYNPKDFNLTKIIQKIKSFNPDVVFIPGMYDDALKIIKEINDNKLTTTFMGSDTWDSPKIADKNSDVLNGSFFLSNFSYEDKNPKTQKFIREFEMTYKTKPQMLAFMTFDILSLIGEMNKNLKTIDKDSIINELTEIKNYQGVSGKISIDKNRLVSKTAYILEIDNQKAKLKTIIENE